MRKKMATPFWVRKENAELESASYVCLTALDREDYWIAYNQATYLESTEGINEYIDTLNELQPGLYRIETGQILIDTVAFRVVLVPGQYFYVTRDNFYCLFVTEKQYSERIDNKFFYAKIAERELS